MPPVSSSPLNPLQRALFDTLSGDATLTTLLGGAGRVVDQPPEGSWTRYIRIGDHTSTADNDLTSFGRNVVETLHIWTKARGNIPGQQIADRVKVLLDHQPDALDVDGHRVVSIRNEFDQALTDPDPQIRHHVLRFRVVTAQTA